MPPRKWEGLKAESRGVETTDFFEAMMEPEAPNEMAFQMDRDRPEDPPQMTFSIEAVNEVAEQFRMYLMARIYGEMQRTGLGPRHLRAYVTLDWAPDDPQHSPKVGPYYQIDKDEGPTPIDGTRQPHVWRHT